MEVAVTSSLQLLKIIGSNNVMFINSVTHESTPLY